MEISNTITIWTEKATTMSTTLIVVIIIVVIIIEMMNGDLYYSYYLDGKFGTC